LLEDTFFLGLLFLFRGSRSTSGEHALLAESPAPTSARLAGRE